MLSYHSPSLGAYRSAKAIACRVDPGVLERIAALDDLLDAFVTKTADKALEQARLAEAAITRGERRGPLHGIPYALKDVFETAGIRTDSTIAHS